TGALISGSSVLTFFTEVTYADSDLNVYVEHNKCECFIDFLLDQGYTYDPNKYTSPTPDDQLIPPTPSNYLRVEFDMPTYDSESVLFVYNFKKEDTGQVVQIIATSHCPLNTILNFHSHESSLCRNVINHLIFSRSLCHEFYQ
ncbi:hypothetical protein ARMGADRAFT_940167, partial [Armillaria gallica]